MTSKQVVADKETMIVPARSAVLEHPVAHSRMPALDGVRGVAILSVMFYHFTGIIGFSSGPGKLALNVTKLGWSGVELFFALSGFLITGILWKARGATASNYFVNFYSRRTLRIVPPAYALIGAILLAGALVPALHTPGYSRFVRDQGWFWLYGVNVAHAKYGFSVFEYDWFDMNMYWTLAVEEHFYLLWPLAMFWLPRRTLMAICLTFVIVSTSLRFGWKPFGPGWPDAALATPREAASLACGCFAALAVSAGHPPSRVTRVSLAAAVLGLGVFLALAVAHAAQDGLLMVSVGRTSLGIGCAGLVTLAATRGIVMLAKLFENRVLVFFGKYSYGLYLYHFTFWPVMKLFNLKTTFGYYTLGALIYLVGAFAVAITLSLLSWNIIEMPILKLKRYFEYKTQTPSA